jgi:tRNA G10  N-methylase Trm11
MIIDYIKCPLYKYTFKVRPIREWVEYECEGKVLNLFAGITKLNVNEIRNDLNPEMPTDYHMDALDFINYWLESNPTTKFNTIILDPPYAVRKSMEKYKGVIASPFRQLKDLIPSVLSNRGKVITFGYQSVSMGSKRGFELEKIALFHHGGAIHDTIACIERNFAII